MEWKNKTILVTGGTGSFGQMFCRVLQDRFRPKKIIVFSRDELKQHQMRNSGFDEENVRFFIGDVRDKERLTRAMNGVDIVVHAAALKQVPVCEYNPNEAILTNVIGVRNIADAAIDTGVQKVMLISTDKAVNPINLYGATKLCAEKLMVQSNSYANSRDTVFSCVRYGNVIGSRGSVIPVFKKQKEKGVLTITDDRMTRFWLSLEQGIDFVIRSIENMQGGEVFVPKIPSMKITELASAVAPECKQEVCGVRPGEKIHEVLISEDDSQYVLEFDNHFIVQPQFPWWDKAIIQGGKPVKPGFRYSSDNNLQWLSASELKKMIDD